MPVIPNQRDSMGAPHVLRTLASNRDIHGGFLGASRPGQGRRAPNGHDDQEGQRHPAVTDGQGLSVVESVLSLSGPCAQLQVTAQAIYDLRSQGGGPRDFRVGRELRFRISEIDAWLCAWRARTTGATTYGVGEGAAANAGRCGRSIAVRRRGDRAIAETRIRDGRWTGGSTDYCRNLAVARQMFFCGGAGRMDADS
jgi:predicted DNA-binding transcriptional regulator AlpA